MCAITGICSPNKTRIDPRLLEHMIGMVRHRGPDDWGLYVEDGIGLGNARLSIIALNSGRQPIHNEDKSIWITFNGEIFNYIELRKELLARGHQFTTRSDTEVVVHLYEEYGEDCVKRLNGQWGFAIWNRKKRKLFLSRDRLGIRPVFYTVVDDTIIFGSEIKSLFAHPAVPRDLDLVGLDQIFTFWCTIPPRTVFKNIHELPPGHSLTFGDGQLAVRPYWQLDFDDAGPEEVNEEERAEELKELLIDATRIRLRSDVAVGAYLSGGLDSTVIAALIKNFTTARLRTFSIQFHNRDLDESAFQRQAIAFLDTDHQQITCDYGDVAAVFPDVIWHTEKPIIRAAPAPLFLLSRLVHQSGYKVVLTGEGADEVFGGYDIYKEAKIRRFWAMQPNSQWRAHLLRRLYPYQQNLQKQPEAYLRHFFRVMPEDQESPFFSHLPRWGLTSRLKMFFSDEVKTELSANNALQTLLLGLPEAYYRWPMFCQAQYLETMFLLPGYILSSQGDRVALAHAVEARHPFLDYRVVEFGAKLPPRYKMKVLNEKYILKRTFGHLIPPDIVRRPKQPYRAPDGNSFFSSPALDYVVDLLAPAKIASDGIFNPAAVAKLVDKFTSGYAIGVKDDMALVGILSTQLTIDQFIRHFAPRGNLCPELKTSCAIS